MQYFVKVVDGIVCDILGFAHKGYVPVELEGIPHGAHSGWYRLIDGQLVYDRALYEEINEIPILQECAGIAAASGDMPDELALSISPELYPVWSQDWRGKAGAIVQDDGQLYRSIHAVGDGQNTKPSETPSMWTRIADPAEEWPEWIQPIGAHDAYAKGAKVSHNGAHWVSSVDGNVWEPGVYGWERADL